TNVRVAGPLRERDLGDETRLDPVCVASEPTRRTRRERTVRRLDLFEPRAQIPRDADAETGPDLAGEDESIPVVVPNEERAEALARAAVERILQRLKTRAPVRQHHADFAVEQRALDAERGGGLRDFTEPRRPVVPVAADEGCAPALDGAADAVAVVFQFVEPLGTVGRLLDQLCELRPIVHARPRIFANHQRSPTKRKRGSLKNSGGLPSKPWPMN